MLKQGPKVLNLDVSKISSAIYVKFNSIPGFNTGISSYYQSSKDSKKNYSFKNVKLGLIQQTISERPYWTASQLAKISLNSTKYKVLILSCGLFSCELYCYLS